MEKSIFKKCLHILDKIETSCFNAQSFYETFLFELNEDDLNLNKDEIFMMYQALVNTNNLEHFDCYFDLSQPLYLFARSHHSSKLEALSIFETLVHHQSYFEYFSNLSESFSLKNLDPFFLPIIKSTILFEKVNGKYIINHDLYDECMWILEDVKNGLNCSDCLKVQYTHDLFDHKKIVYRNEKTKIINYRHLNRMMNIYPKHGIPIDRDHSKDLQVFFKDCLFNEFKHACCVCGIDIPHMLIASHIKPFRDCGYLVEAMDSNNGLLLCRNHDYLFDQGYFSFDDKGHILISEEIINKKEIFNINENFQFELRHMTTSRKEFFAYHRLHYYRKK